MMGRIVAAFVDSCHLMLAPRQGAGARSLRSREAGAWSATRLAVVTGGAARLDGVEQL